MSAIKTTTKLADWLVEHKFLDEKDRDDAQAVTSAAGNAMFAEEKTLDAETLKQLTTPPEAEEAESVATTLTEIKNLFAVGDGAGVSRGLIQASASGIIAAREILKRIG